MKSRRRTVVEFSFTEPSKAESFGVVKPESEADVGPPKKWQVRVTIGRICAVSLLARSEKDPRIGQPYIKICFVLHSFLRATLETASTVGTVAREPLAEDLNQKIHIRQT